MGRKEPQSLPLVEVNDASIQENFGRNPPVNVVRQPAPPPLAPAAKG